MAQLANGNEVVSPSKADAALAKVSGQKLAVHLGRKGELRLELRTEGSSEELVLPASAGRLLARALAEMGQGNGVASPHSGPSSRASRRPTSWTSPGCTW
jgi:hypothetical protein